MKENRQADEGHVLKLWKPFSFEVTEDLDYLRDAPAQRLFYVLLRFFVLMIMTPFLFVFQGFRIRGREQLRGLSGAVTVTNHVHVLDCVMIARTLFFRTLYFLSLASNFRIPVVRHLIRALHAVPLGGGQKTERLFSELSSAVKKGAFVQIYPEAVLLPYERTLRPFKSGAFRLAVMADAPLLPCVYTFRKPAGLYRLFRRKPCVTLTLLPPLRPDPSLDEAERVAALKDAAYSAMEREITRIYSQDK